jgi:hypothetical protein
MFFFVAESQAWHTRIGASLPWVGVGLLFVLLALVPWRWELVGGLLLTIVGLLAGVAYAIWSPPRLAAVSRVLTTVVFGVPPVAAGILFLRHRRAVPPNP